MLCSIALIILRIWNSSRTAGEAQDILIKNSKKGEKNRLIQYLRSFKYGQGIADQIDISVNQELFLVHLRHALIFNTGCHRTGLLGGCYKAEKKSLKVNFMVTFVGLAETTLITEMVVLNVY